MILVIAASRHDSTSEVADEIADRLRGAGRAVERCAADRVTGLGEAEAVVLGSPIYAGRWLESARRLLAEQAEALAARPVWLFSLGPLGDPPKPEEPEPQELPAAAEAVGARDCRVFSGRLDRRRLNRRERLMVRAVRAPDGDFRDWDAIRSWADSIGDALGRSAP